MTLSSTIRHLMVVAMTMATVLSLSATGFSSVTVDVVPAFGPDFSMSPSTTGFYANAISALRGMAVPNRDDNPSGYEVVPPGLIPLEESMVSEGFNSWRGMADPTPGWDDGTITPGVFAGEFGNAIYFGLRAVVADPVNDKIRLSDLSGEIHWEDLGVGPSTVFTQTLSFAAGSLASYTSTRVGVDFGPDNAPGGGDDIVITAGASTQLVDAIYLVGLADAIFVSPSMPPLANDQAELDDAVMKLLAAPQQQLLASYSIGSVNMPMPDTGMGVVTFVPEPSGLGILTVVFLGFALRRRHAGL